VAVDSVTSFHLMYRPIAACARRNISGAIWDVPRHELIFWRGHINCWKGPGGYSIPYTTRFHELQFLGKNWLISTVLCPHILNIAWTIEQLNLNFSENFFGTAAQKFMGAQKLLRGHDASASLRHPQMAPATFCHRIPRYIGIRCTFHGASNTRRKPSTN